MEHKSPHPESLMMTYGYQPAWSMGAIKPPLFLTSTFVFETAEEGKSFFEFEYGLRSPYKDEERGLVYSRINNPNLEILEDRLCLWDQAEECAVFGSGMAAIATVLMEFLKPGDLFLYSTPTYGGTDHFIHHFLKERGIEGIGFHAGQTKQEILAMLETQARSNKLGVIYIESPSNPTNDLFDIQMGREIADHFSSSDRKVQVVVDNTYMGPLWCNPLGLGADLVLYSATKFIGGHSDLIAGAVLGNSELIKRVKILRTFLGNMASPHTGWLLLRSLETMKVRMDQQARNAQEIAQFLQSHPLVKKVLFLDFLPPSSPAYQIYKTQYSSAGSMISFYIDGGEEEAFRFLNHLRLIKLAVSLGSTESLVQHPASMTHAGVCSTAKESLGITDNLVRLSVGLEYSEDLIADLKNALKVVREVVPVGC